MNGINKIEFMDLRHRRRRPPRHRKQEIVSFGLKKSANFTVSEPKGSITKATPTPSKTIQKTQKTTIKQ